MNPITEIVDEIFDLYSTYGNADYIGEPVSQIEHMSQAAQLAAHEGFDGEVILAAFFHDIGHLCVMSTLENSMGGYGVKSHEKIGADFLRSKGFSERLARLVESHVQAKRYLTFKDSTYYNSLSEASKQTLAFQGGPMNKNEAIQFENDPLFESMIQMRRWDEMAKEENATVMDLNDLKQRAISLLSSGGNQ
jgi:phosphonate degradation associated HDIG domain protein